MAAGWGGSHHLRTGHQADGVGRKGTGKGRHARV